MKSSEEILKELPELAVTEQDAALKQAILALPEVQKALQETVGHSVFMSKPIPPSA